jgi:hypothetical protein
LIPAPPVNRLPRIPRKQRLLQRYEALKSERSPWVAVWKQQADYVLPRRFRDQASQRNKPATNEKLINNTPTQAARTLASGLMSGLTSPARPWFRLGVPDYQGGRTGAVKKWLDDVENVLKEVLIRSNVYNGLAHIFGDLGVFCTAAMLIEEDDKEVVRSYVLPLGSFVLACSARGQVDTMIREVPMTVGQVVEQFGLESCSLPVRDLYNRGQLDTVVEVIHSIEPNPNHVPGSPAARCMAWCSLWFEYRSNAQDDKFLRVAGFHEFPVMAPRWNVTGTDTYGTGPGFDALGDAKALQLLERRKAMVIDRITNPPMVAPSALKAGRPSLLPGDVTYLDRVAGGQGFEPAITINPQAIGAIDEVIRQHEDRVNRAFYADLWLALSMDDRNQRATAREVAERHEEKLIALGPTLERLHDELLDKLIERVFNICLRRGLLPAPPQELQGQTIRVEYISVMAAAQRLLGVSAVERLASFIGNLAGAKPEALDKLNVDQLVEDYAEMLGTSPDLLFSKDEVSEMRAQKAAAQQKAQEQQLALQQGPEMAKSAELLSRTDVGGTSALNRLLAAQGGGGPLTGGSGLPVAA